MLLVLKATMVKNNKARYDRVFYLGRNNSLSMSCIRFLIDFVFPFSQIGEARLMTQDGGRSSTRRIWKCKSKKKKNKSTGIY